MLCALSDLPEDDPIIQNEYKLVVDTVREMQKGGLADCLKRNPNRNLHRTILGYVNQMFQQVRRDAFLPVLYLLTSLSYRSVVRPANFPCQACLMISLGINIITYYAATIFEQDIRLSGFLSRLLAAVLGTEYFLASILAIFTIEKCGRRTLMLIGAMGQAGSMAVLAGTTADVTQQSGIAAAAFLFVFNSFFAWGWLGMTW